MTNTELREQNKHDLYVLLHDLAEQVLRPTFDHKYLDQMMEDVTDDELAGLVDKTAHVKEWMGWS